MSDADKKIDLDEYKQNLSSTVVKELFQIALTERKDHGQQFSDELLMSIVVSIMATMILRSLQDHEAPPERDVKLEARFAPPFTEMKQAIQNAVSSAFTGAFLGFDAGRGTDFVCQITKVPPPPSKLAH